MTRPKRTSTPSPPMNSPLSFRTLDHSRKRPKESYSPILVERRLHSITWDNFWLSIPTGTPNPLRGVAFLFLDSQSTAETGIYVTLGDTAGSNRSPIVATGFSETSFSFDEGAFQTGWRGSSVLLFKRQNPDSPLSEWLLLSKT